MNFVYCCVTAAEMTIKPIWLSQTRLNVRWVKESRYMEGIWKAECERLREGGSACCGINYKDLNLQVVFMSECLKSRVCQHCSHSEHSQTLLNRVHLIRYGPSLPSHPLFTSSQCRHTTTHAHTWTALIGMLRCDNQIVLSIRQGLLGAPCQQPILNRE